MYARAPGERRAIASTTKLMTALLVLERARPGQVFTAPAYHAGAAESRIDLAAGERMTVADLLKALLLESANDAAVTLARGVSGSTARFVDAMNERARQLGLDDTSYANPVGLDAPGGYSTARDLADTGRSAHARPALRAHRRPPLGPARAPAPHPRVVENRNLLIGRYPFVTGVKTGHTMRAGYVLVGAAGRRGEGRVVSVVLGEPSEAARDVDTLGAPALGAEPLPSRPGTPPRAHRGGRRDRPQGRARRARAAPRGLRDGEGGTAHPAPDRGPGPPRRTAGRGHASRQRHSAGGRAGRSAARRWSRQAMYPVRVQCG